MRFSVASLGWFRAFVASACSVAWLLAAADAAAQLPLDSHFRADVFGSGVTTFFDPLAVSGETSAAIGPLAGGVGLAINASAEARGQLDSASLLQVRTSSAAPPATSEVNDSFGSAIATAQWRDILFASGGTAPSEVQLNFSVHGTLSVPAVGPSSVFFRPNVSRAGFIASAAATTTYGGLGFGTVMSGPPTEFAPSVKVQDDSNDPFSALASSVWTTSSLTSLNGVDWDFSGTFEFVTSLFSAGVLGEPDPGYLILVAASAGTSMRGSSGSADFASTLSLDSITLAGGGALPDDVSFFFDSGLTVTQAPEPSAWAMLIFGLATLLMSRQRAA